MSKDAFNWTGLFRTLSNLALNILFLAYSLPPQFFKYAAISISHFLSYLLGISEALEEEKYLLAQIISILWSL